jgi:hypothetical protein
MSDWPDGLKVGPIREWPGELTRERRFAPFKTSEFDSYRRRSTPLSSTLELLDRELRMIGGRGAELLVAIAPADFRLDGKPRAQAKAAHPGVILSFDSNVGHLSYPCDTFTTWQDNLRAIALALEALRKVDRYGVTKRGEQYRGFMALEATAAPAGFADVNAALRYLVDVASKRAHVDTADDAAKLLRIAQRAAHPDMGGDAATFQRVSLAEAKLREAGLL